MSSKMLIGSKAALHHFPDFYRKTKDVDYIGEKKEGEDNKICPAFQYILDKHPDLEIASPEILYTLKLSHSFWNIHWYKTINDLSFFQKKGIKYIPELFNLLYKGWVEIHGKKRANLVKSNEEFFRDNVGRLYVHDDIHAATCYHDKPLYFYIKKDESLALTSEELFNKLSHTDKMRLCREEIYVTALERFLIPQAFKVSVKWSYLEAIKLLVTSMTKGFFPLFINSNILELRQLDSSHDWVSLFKGAEKNGQIRKVK